MSEAIEAGVVDSFKSAVNSLSGLLGKSLEWLKDSPLDAKDGKAVKNDNGESIGYMFTAVTGANHKVKVKVLNSTARESAVDLYMLGDNGAKDSKPGIQPKDVDDYVFKFIDEEYGEGFEEYTSGGNEDFNVEQNFKPEPAEVAEAHKIQVSLSKVQASGEIKYHAIYANYDSESVYQDLQLVLDDDELVESLTEEPKVLEIVPYEDSITVDEIDKVQEMDYISAIVKTQYELIFALQSMYYDFTGADYGIDKELMISVIRGQLDFLIHSKYGINLDNFAILESIDFEAVKNERSDAADRIENYALTLDLYYPNFPHEVQLLLDEWLLSLRFFDHI